MLVIWCKKELWYVSCISGVCGVLCVCGYKSVAVQQLTLPRVTSYSNCVLGIDPSCGKVWTRTWLPVLDICHVLDSFGCEAISNRTISSNHRATTTVRKSQTRVASSTRIENYPGTTAFQQGIGWCREHVSATSRTVFRSHGPTMLLFGWTCHEPEQAHDW